MKWPCFGDEGADANSSQNRRAITRRRRDQHKDHPEPFRRPRHIAEALAQPDFGKIFYKHGNACEFGGPRGAEGDRDKDFG